MDIKISRISKDIPLPETEYGSSFILCSRVYHTIKPKEMVSIPTNIKVNLPFGYIGVVTHYPQTKYSGILVMPTIVGWRDKEEVEVSIYNYLDNEYVALASGEPIAIMFILRLDSTDSICIVEE